MSHSDLSLSKYPAGFIFLQRLCCFSFFFFFFFRQNEAFTLSAVLVLDLLILLQLKFEEPGAKSLSLLGFNLHSLISLKTTIK